MKRNPILYVLLAILIAQPLLIVGFGPSTTATVMQPDDVTVLSQGTRLDPGDHTDHVPILIDGTGDFVAQGWPGAGTSGDPYVIAGLNITYGIGLACIAIFNTDAYFVIRDSFIGQNSALNGIHLENTSHATIEYVTVSSPSHAIHAMNANNTLFSHIDVTASGTNNYALDLQYSNLCTLESSVMVSVDYRCVVSSYCDTFTMHDNILTAVDHKYAVNAYSSPTFTSTNDVILEGYSMRVDYSNHSTVTGLTSNAQWGVQFPFSYFCSVIDCDIIAYNYDGVYLNTGDSNTATGNTIDAYRYGLYVINSNDTVFEGNTIENAGTTGVFLDAAAHHTNVTLNDVSSCTSYGLYVSTSIDVQIEGNSFTDPGTYGIYVANSMDANIEDNTITDVGTTGIYVSGSNDTLLIDNILSEIGSNGIDLQTCYSSSVSENEISECGNVGILISGGAFTDVWYNDISDCDDIGLWVNAHGMFEAWENTMTETDGGIYVWGSDETYIRDNDVYSSTAYGMYIRNSENHTIDDNSFYDCATTGIELDNCDTSSFTGNQIFTGPDFGIYSYDSEYCTFSGNMLTDCGFFFPEEQMDYDFNHTFTGNEVNGLPVLYAIDEASGSYSGASYGQLILVACNDTTITGGTFDRATAPICLYNSLRTSIDGVTSLNNLYGIFNEQSDNTTIINCVIIGSETGIFVKDSPFVAIGFVDMSNCMYGIWSHNADFLTMTDASFVDLSNSGLYDNGQSNNVTVWDCEFYNISSYGIRVGGDSYYMNITNNLFEYCNYALYTYSTFSDFGVFIGNEVYYSSNCGIYFSETDFWNIQNNTILWSFNYGIYITGNAVINAGWYISYNTIGLSGDANAYNSNSGNFWDDTVDTGNWWDDYSGTGTYSIDGGGAVDNYPMQFQPTEPIMNELMDVWYAEGTTGNEISWSPYDNYLKDYTVTIGGVLWEQDAVPGIVNPTITVNIDGLAYGVHTLVMTVTDIDLNSVSDTIIINVFDDTPPIINNPPSFEIFLGVTGNEIVWEADDLHPGNYVAMMDGSEYATGSWTSGEVPLNIDGLSVGVHHFTMIAYDLDGNSVSDSVSILVINDATGPSIDSPEDIVFVVESTGNRIIWTPTDDYPDSFEIEFNETIMVSGDWSGGRIIFELDNLAVGDYNFTVTVFDGGEQSATDTVAVQVIPYEGWTPTLPPPDFTLLIIAGVGIAGVVVVIGVVYFLKFKKPSSGGA